MAPSRSDLKRSKKSIATPTWAKKLQWDTPTAMSYLADRKQQVIISSAR